MCSEADLKIFTYIEEHTDWRFSWEAFRRIQGEWGNLGAPTMFMPRVSVQRLYIDLMGVEEGIYALYDYPETVEAYFDALRESQFRLIDVINASPVQIINFGDNVHSGTLSPALFEKYVLPEYRLRCQRLHQGGKFVCAHFDGDNRGLMGFYRQTGLDGIEAITPKPQGDVTLQEVQENLGDMFLLDGSSTTTLYLTWSSGAGTREAEYVWPRDGRLWDVVFGLAQSKVKEIPLKEHSCNS